MADITGRSYEAFVEFLLRRLGYRDEWTAGSGRQYLYEAHPTAPCHQAEGICANSRECSQFSKTKGLSYGPWYDPDFFILDADRPIACLHVTHWSNPSSSQYKFWRTIEDHLQYKTLFGRGFLSINLVFLALDPTEPPRFVDDSQELIELHGWKPATGSVLAVSFDSSLLFPIEYRPIDRFVVALPAEVPASARKRRVLYNEVWSALYTSDANIKRAVDQAARLLRKSLNSQQSLRYTDAAIARLQGVCWQGRKRAVGLHPTATRYRKGLQHGFIVQELIARTLGKRIDAEASLWSILSSNPRFPWKAFRSVISAGASIKDTEIEARSCPARC